MALLHIVCRKDIEHYIFRQSKNMLKISLGRTPEQRMNGKIPARIKRSDCKNLFIKIIRTRILNPKE